MRHAGAVGLHQAVLAEIRPEVGAHEPARVDRTAEALEEVSPEGERSLRVALFQRVFVQIIGKALARYRPRSELNTPIKQVLFAGEAAAQQRAGRDARGDERAQGTLADAVRVSLLGVEEARVATEELVAAVARKGDLHFAASELRKVEGRHVCGIGERLV